MSVTRFKPVIWLTLVPFCWLTAQDAGDDFYELTPFAVRAGDPDSYIAQNALSATRFDTPIRNIPMSLQVVTEAFLRDTFATDLESGLEFVASVVPTNESYRERGNFAIRGFDATRVKRDGLTAHYSQDMTNIARIEVVKGPASLLYGEAQPGGIINYIPKRPLDEPRHTISTTVGSYSYYRAVVNSTAPLWRDADNRPRILYRFDTSWEDVGGWRLSAEANRTFFSAVLEFRPTRRSSVFVEWETMRHRRITPHGLPVYNAYQRAQWEAAPDNSPMKTQGAVLRDPLLRTENWTPVFDTEGIYANDPRFIVNPTTNIVSVVYDRFGKHWGHNFAGESENDFNTTRRDRFAIDYQTPLFSQNWFLKATVQYDETSLDIVETRPIRFLSYSSFAARYGPTQMSGTYFENKTVQAQAQITGKWELAGVRNQTLTGVEWQDGTFRALFWDRLGPSSELVLPLVGSGVEVFINPNLIIDPRTFVPVRNFDNPAGFDFRDASFRALYLSNLASFWQDRIKVLAGLRYDQQDQDVLDRDRQVTERTPTLSKTVPQVGVIYSPIESVNLYASYSESFVPRRQLLRRWDPVAEEITRVPASPFVGVGREIGVKVDLLDERISGTIAFFDIENRNVIQTIRSTKTLADGSTLDVTEQFQNAVSTSRGVDMDLIFTVGRQLQLIANYAYITSETVRDGGDFRFKGTVGVPRHQATAWMRYAFLEGNLEGLSLGGGAVYNGRRRGFDPATAEIYLDPYVKFDTLVSYRLPLGDARATVSLNVKNVFNKKYFGPGGMPANPREAFLTLRYEF